MSNRRAFQSRIETNFTEAKLNATPLTLILMDVDNFKGRNDELGHAAGDEALSFIGSVLKSCILGNDTAVRLGGEEFGLLLPNLDASLGLKIAERVQNALRHHPDVPANLTMSIGIATTDLHTRNWDQLFSQADNAMYEAKNAGKNRIVAHHSRPA